MMAEENKPQKNFENGELADAELDEVTGGKGSLPPMDQFQLQQLMEQKGQLESMISNTMKASSESQSGIAGSLKGS